MRKLGLLHDLENSRATRDLNADPSGNVERGWINEIHDRFSPSDISLVSRLIIPEFVVHEDVVFLEMNFSIESFDTFKDKGVDMNHISDVFNNVHAYDIFRDSQIEDDNSLICFLQILKISWGLSMEKLFPERRFILEVRNSSDDYGPTLYIHPSEPY